jgi:hypothetical protein
MRVSRRAGNQPEAVDATIVYNPNEDSSIELSPEVSEWGDTSDEVVLRAQGSFDKKLIADARR